MVKRILWVFGLIFLVLLMMGTPTKAAEVEVGKIPLNFSVDLRLRSEYIDHDGFNNADYRWRQRYRLRFGLTADITEHTTVGFRLSSGASGYPTSGYQTFDSANFDKFQFSIDRVYVGYKRELGPALMTIYLGKFGHPFYTPSEIVWDVDLQPTGAAELFNFKEIGITLAAAQYFIRETRNVAGTGSNLYAEQISWKGDFEPAAAGLGVAYYAVSNPEQVASDANANNADFRTNKNFGTCTGNPGATPATPLVCTGTISNFKILNVSAETTFKQLPLPLKLVGEYVVNLGAKEAVVGGNQFGKEDRAWLAAAYLGKAKEKGDWRIGAGYTEIQADAVVASFNNDDLQQTNVNTIFTELRYQLHSKIYVYYDGYYQRRNNFDLAVANGNAATDNTRRYRHRVTLVVEF